MDNGAAVRLSILIVNFGTRSGLDEALHLLLEGIDDDIEIVVVDHDEEPRGAPPWARNVRWIIRRNTGYADGVNRAAAAATGRYLLLLNPDVLVTANVVRRLARVLDDHPDVVAVSPLHQDEAGRSTNPFHDLPTVPALIGHATVLRRTPVGPLLVRPWQQPDLHPRDGGLLEVAQPPASCLMVRRSALGERVFDPRFPLYFNDVDLCRRLLAKGGHIVVLADVTCFHEPGTSTSLLGDRRLGEWCISAYRYVRLVRRRAIAEAFRVVILTDLVIRGYLLGQRDAKRAVRQLLLNVSIFEAQREPIHER